MTKQRTMTDAEFVEACVNDYCTINDLQQPLPPELQELVEADICNWMDEAKPTV